jgi:hypothetical protein
VRGGMSMRAVADHGTKPDELSGLSRRR